MGDETMAKRRMPPSGGDPRATFEELLKLAGEGPALGNLPIPEDSPSPHEFVGDGFAWYCATAIVTHPDGYLRPTVDRLGSELHLVFHWLRGTLAGRYVYVRVPWYQLKYGVTLLHHKICVAETENGKGSAFNKPKPKREPAKSI